MIYLLIIGWILIVVVILMFFAGANVREREIPEPVEDKKIDADRAYLESQYGVDDYVRGLRNGEENKSHSFHNKNNG